MSSRAKTRERGESSAYLPGTILLYALLLVLTALTLRWLLLSIHSDLPVSSGSTQTVPVGIAVREKTAKVDLMSKLDVFANNAASDALADLVYIKKIYTIPEGDLVAPAPDPAKYGHTNDPAEVQAVVDAAAELLDGQEIHWRPEIERMPGSEIVYYYDETILVICWKEVINNCCVSFSEVKIAHGSQLRRTIAGNSYGSGVRYTASDMAKSSNAVVAIDGDFYDFRQLGITVYQRQVYRNKPQYVDSCFFTSEGDLLFSHRGELMGEGEAEQFVKDNDVLFAIAFGPILVEDGVVTNTTSYPVGEVLNNYTRAAIGQYDKLHYLLMTAGFDGYYSGVPTINGAAQIIYDKGVKNAYAVDGGQSAVLYVDGGPFNHVDFGWERTMSDIIYFATALPAEEVES